MGQVDVFRLFRKCFLCKGTKNLCRVVPPGYHTTFDYYHQECLEKVIASPELFEKYIDSAIQITDQLREDKRREDSELARVHNLANKLRTLRVSSINFDDVKNILNNVVVEVEPDIKNKQEINKFEKIFKKE